MFAITHVNKRNHPPAALSPFCASIDARLREMPPQYFHEMVPTILKLSEEQCDVLQDIPQNSFTGLKKDVCRVLFSLSGINALLEKNLDYRHLNWFKTKPDQLTLLLSPEGIALLQLGALTPRIISKYNISAQHLELILNGGYALLLHLGLISIDQICLYGITEEQLELLLSNESVALMQANILSLKKIHERKMSADEIYIILMDSELIIYLLDHCSSEHKDAMCELILSLSRQERERLKLILDDMLAYNISNEIRLLMMRPQAIPLLLERWINVNDLRHNVDLDKLRLVCNRKGLVAMRKFVIAANCLHSDTNTTMTQLQNALNSVATYSHLPHFCFPPCEQSSVGPWRTR